MMLNPQSFSLCQVLDSIIGHELKLYKPQAHLDIRKIFLPSESMMSGIDCLSHYSTMVRYQHLKSDLTVI